MKKKRSFIQRHKIMTIVLLFILVIGIVGGKFIYDILDPQRVLRAGEEVNVNSQFSDSKVNILFYGLDKDYMREEVQNYTVYRSDMIMVATLDFEKNTVDIVSVPRDTYVPIYNQSEKDKVNSCFMHAYNDVGDASQIIPKGTEYLTETVSSVLGGIPIDYYVGLTDMEVVADIVNEIGGVEIDVLEPLYADRGHDRSTVQIKEGTQTLDGSQLLYYARYRSYPLGDIDRVKNQQHIMKSLFNEAKSANTLVKIPQIYDLVKENIVTNLDAKQITALSLFATKLDGIETYTLPGNFGDFGGISYWVMDQKKVADLIYQLYGIKVEPKEQDEINDKSNELDEFSITVAHPSLDVGHSTFMTITGKSKTGQVHNYQINDTSYSLSTAGIIQVNADNTIVAKSPGSTTLTVEVDGRSSSVTINVAGGEVSPSVPSEGTTEQKPESVEPSVPVVPTQPEGTEPLNPDISSDLTVPDTGETAPPD